MSGHPSAPRDRKARGFPSPLSALLCGALALSAASAVLLPASAIGEAPLPPLFPALPNSPPRDARALLRMTAHPAAPAPPRPALPSFSFLASKGYEIVVEGAESTVFLSVFRPGAAGRATSSSSGAAKGPSSFGAAITTYIARGEVSSRGLRAGFADLGRVAVHFHPSGAGRSRGCRRAGHSLLAGVFRGEIDFEGEGGYTSAHLHRAKGIVRLLGASRCSPPPARSPRRSSTSRPLPRPGRAKSTSFAAGWKSALGATLSLGGHRRRPHGPLPRRQRAERRPDRRLPPRSSLRPAADLHL